MPSIALSVDADLRFSLSTSEDRAVDGHLTGSGTTLRLLVSDPTVFAGRSDARAVRGFADALAAGGVQVTVVADSGPLVTLGAPRTTWWQRRVTGSRHIRIERGAGLWSLARGRARATAGALPISSLAPPAMVWPPAPTFLRRRRSVSTTHDPSRGGDPRLIMAPRAAPGPSDTQQVYRLRSEVTTIGSDPDCDIRLAGLEPRHAEIRHDDRDEFVLVRLAVEGETRVNGARVDTSLLRTASRVQLGTWTMSFYREEFADHGRPHGGRVGGELGRQRPQPGRGHGASVSDWSGEPPVRRRNSP